MSKKAIIASLLQAKRPDLANHMAHAKTTRKRPGSARDDKQYPPDLVFEVPANAKIFWYGPGSESEGLYVGYGIYEYWWFDINARKAEQIAEQVADVIIDAEQNPHVDIAYELKKLGAG